MDKTIKRAACDIKKLSRKNLESAFLDLMKVSLQKTELIETMTQDFKLAADAVKRIGEGD